MKLIEKNVTGLNAALTGLMNLDISVVSRQEHQEDKTELVEQIKDLALFGISKEYALRQSGKKNEKAASA